MSVLRLRGGTAAQWSTANPILEAREPGVVVPGGSIKVGDGTTRWNDLPYSGSGGGAQAFVFEQQTPAQVWTVHHNLGFHPSGVFVVDSGGTEWVGTPARVNDNTLTLTWTAPFAGTVYLS